MYFHIQSDMEYIAILAYLLPPFHLTLQGAMDRAAEIEMHYGRGITVEIPDS